MRDMFSLIEKVARKSAKHRTAIAHNERPWPQHPERIGQDPSVEEVALSERSLRTLMDSLGPQGLVDVKQSILANASIGLDVLEAMEQALDDHHESFLLAQSQGEAGLQEVWIVKGDADVDPKGWCRLGRSSRVFTLNLDSGRQVLAMTGGSLPIK